MLTQNSTTNDTMISVETAVHAIPVVEVPVLVANVVEARVAEVHVARVVETNL